MLEHLTDKNLITFFCGLYGLLIGSFLNVVIHRLPLMLEQQWAYECSECEHCAQTSRPAATRITLSHPRSRCPKCGHMVAWRDNIPVLSWLLLRGKCRHCSCPISARYPLVEIATAALFAWCAHQWGESPTTAAWCGFCAVLLSLALIDVDTQYLPDALTQPLLWTGLVCSSMGWLQGLSLQDSLWGAAAGYCSLWGICWLFKAITGKEGMGHGDYKLFAALGAWFGWQALAPMMAIAACSFSVAALVLHRTKFNANGCYAFGPFLALAGFVLFFLDPVQWLQNISF